MSYSTHGEAGRLTPEYKAWQSMKSRCYSPSYRYYQHYGGRGIKVCDKWRDDYPAFLADVGRRPSPKHSLDRIDNNSDYAPGNVRWATPTQQLHNRRYIRQNTSGIKGVSWHTRSGRWVGRVDVDGRPTHLGKFTTVEEAAVAVCVARELLLFLRDAGARA